MYDTAQVDDNKNNNWKSADGRVCSLNNMEEQHLLNTLMYMSKRLEDFNKIRKLAKKKGLEIPQLRVSGKMATEWIELFFEELNKRQCTKLASITKYLKEEYGP